MRRLLADCYATPASADALRAARLAPRFLGAIRLHLVEGGRVARLMLQPEDKEPAEPAASTGT